MRLRVRPRHLLIFTVRGKKKYKGLYTPQTSSYADHYEAMKVWVADMGDGCRTEREGVRVGTQGYVLDVFDLEELPVNVFEEYYTRSPQLYGDLVEEAKMYDGEITSEIIHENSLIGVIECQKNNSHSESPSLAEQMC